MIKKETYHSRYASFYNSSEWRKLRALKFANANGLCERCYANGKIVPAKEIHHIEPIEDNWDRRLDYDNLMALCSSCHNEIHNRESELQKFLKEFDKI